MYEKEFNRIISASRKNSLTFFVGAGVSALSTAPSWKALINDICRKMGREVKDEYSSDELLRIPQMFFYSIKKDEDAYYDFIESHLSLSNLEPNLVHKELLSFNPSSIITTNFDGLLEDAAIQYCQSFKSIAGDSEVPSINGDRFILKVHGDIKHRNIVFKEEDYLNYSDNFKLIETLLKSIFSTNTVVFIGYSLNDYNIKLVLNWVKTLLKDDFNRPIFVHVGSEHLTPEDLLYQESKGLSVIDYEKIGEYTTDYLSRYMCVINEVKKSARLSFDGKTAKEAFDLTYELLEPLDKLDSLRVEDVADKLSPNIIIEGDGTIVNTGNGSSALKLFVDINGLSSIEYEPLPEEIRRKYELILSVFSKARVNRMLSDKKLISFSGKFNEFADKLCITLDYKEMYSYTKKEYKTAHEKYLKGFYLTRIRKYDDAFYCFAEVARDAFKSKDYLLYYFAEINRITLYGILKRLNFWYKCYDQKKMEALFLDEDTENIYRRLPVEFRNQYASLMDVHSAEMLYKYSYQAFADGQKLLKTLNTPTIEYGFTSCEKVICRINESLHFLLGNHLVIDTFIEYRDTVINLMSLLLSKYAVQNVKRLREPAFLGEDRDKIAFDITDFYCFVEYFKSEDIDSLLKERKISSLEFRSIEEIETSVSNILDYYDFIIKRASNANEIRELQTRIKTCMTLLRYVDISQDLVDRICGFILNKDFQEIHIDDKILFLDRQLYQRKMYSKKTAKAIEDKLIWYIDTNINALDNGKTFECVSSNSTIGYCNLIHYISPHDERYHSRRISSRVAKIIKGNYASLFSHIVRHYWAYISTYQRRKVVSWAKQKIIADFSFDMLTLLIECNARIEDAIIFSTKNYLNTSIERKLIAAGKSNITCLQEENPYEELNQIGYWCLMRALPLKFSEYVGHSDLFDFFYLYRAFDFNKFDARWLLYVNSRVLPELAKNAKVRNAIREKTADMLNHEKLAELDRDKLSNILVQNFC